MNFTDVYQVMDEIVDELLRRLSGKRIAPISATSAGRRRLMDADLIPASVARIGQFRSDATFATCGAVCLVDSVAKPPRHVATWANRDANMAAFRSIGGRILSGCIGAPAYMLFSAGGGARSLFLHDSI